MLQNNEHLPIFKTPLSTDFWKISFDQLKSVRMLVIAALFIALRLVVARFFIPLPLLGTQRIYFSYIVNALGSLIYGPIVGGISGMISDLIGATLFPTGPFFFGYTITSMMGSFLYGVFLFRSKITVARLLACKFTVNLIANVILNSLWDSFFVPKGFWVLLISRIPKNLIMLPIEVIILTLFFGAILPILKKQGIINYSPFEKKIPFFKPKLS